MFNDFLDLVSHKQCVPSLKKIYGLSVISHPKMATMKLEFKNVGEMAMSTPSSGDGSIVVNSTGHVTLFRISAEDPPSVLQIADSLLCLFGVHLWQKLGVLIHPP